jgi:hypothetical protein
MAHDVVADDGAVVDGRWVGARADVDGGEDFTRMATVAAGGYVMSCFSPALEVFAIERACNCETHCVAKVGSD